MSQGFLPGMATYRLAKYIGLGRAKRMIMRSQKIDAHKAVSMGIIDEVFYDLEDGITKTVESFGSIHPVVVQLSRRLMNESYPTSFENAIGNFLAAQHRAITQTEFLEMLRKKHKARSTKGDS